MRNVARNKAAEFLTEGDLEEMGIASRRTLQGWRLLGRGPAYYRLTSGMVRYRRSEIEAWLAARAVGPSREILNAARAVPQTVEGDR